MNSHPDTTTSPSTPACAQPPPNSQHDSLLSITTALIAPPYPWNALEPFISADQLEQHFSAHHAPHAAALALPLTPDLSIVECLASHLNWIHRRLRNLRTATGHSGGARTLAIRLLNIGNHVRLHAGGHVNHTLFWRWMAPADSGPGSPVGTLAAALDAAFGSFCEFKACFAHAAISVEGDGWAWLIVRADHSLLITTTQKEDNPLMRSMVPAGELGIPILGLDLAAHACTPQYQDDIERYVNAWWQVVNWTQVSADYEQFAQHTFLLAPPAHDPLWGGDNEPRATPINTSPPPIFKGLLSPVAPCKLSQEEALNQAHLRKAQRERLDGKEKNRGGDRTCQLERHRPETKT